MEAENEEEWYNALLIIKNKMRHQRNKKIALFPPVTDKRGIETEKIMEVIFHGTDIKCIIFVRKLEGRKERVPIRDRNRGTDALIINQEGKTYAELLKKVKEGLIEDAKISQSIKTIRQTKQGEMVIIVDNRDKEAVQNIKREVKKLGKVNTRLSTENTRRSRSIVYIRNIDGVTTKEEVEAAIRKEIQIEGALEMGNLRPYFGGNQATIISLQRQEAMELIKKGRIKIGLNECTVTERLLVVRSQEGGVQGKVRL